MNETTSNLRAGLEQAWALTLSALPKFLVFLVILIAGYFIAKLLCRLVDAGLEKLHFDRLVERGGIKRALERTGWDASSIIGRIVFWAVFLLALQLAFGVFGPNPISDLLTRIIAFLPDLIVAALIVIIAAAVATGVRELASAAFGGFSYGRTLANLAAGAVVVIGVFAALSHLQIAPAIVNGLFYALLAIVAGSAIVAIGGGGIVPMRSMWERTMNRIEAEAPRLQAEASEGARRAEARAREMREQSRDVPPEQRRAA